MAKLTKEEAIRKWNAAKAQKKECAKKVISQMREAEIRTNGKEPKGFVVW